LRAAVNGTLFKRKERRRHLQPGNPKRSTQTKVLWALTLTSQRRGESGKGSGTPHKNLAERFTGKGRVEKYLGTEAPAASRHEAVLK